MLLYSHPTNKDLKKLDAWVSADPAHKDLFTGSHFILQPDQKGVQCIEVRDEEGTVFYLKFTNALMVEAQFPPDADQQSIRISTALKDAFGFFSHSSKNLGYHAMLFESVSENLILFFEKFGFKRLKNFFKVNL